jgi:hypothetical protein
MTKKPIKKSKQTANANAMKRFTIDVPAELHTRIKVECARRGLKMADVIRDLSEREFSKRQTRTYLKIA